MSSRGGLTVIPNAAERRFARKIEAQGKTWISQPRQFTLPEPYRSYRPDFYVVEDNCFYEVLGTRQAYSQQREKIAAFKVTYPHLTLKIINEGAWSTNPESYDPESFNRMVELQVQARARWTMTTAVIDNDGYEGYVVQKDGVAVESFYSKRKATAFMNRAISDEIRDLESLAPPGAQITQPVVP